MKEADSFILFPVSVQTGRFVLIHFEMNLHLRSEISNPPIPPYKFYVLAFSLKQGAACVAIHFRFHLSATCGAAV